MSSATATPVAPEFVIGFPANFRDLPLASEPATWEATASAFLGLVPVARPPEYRELALAHLRAYSGLLATGGVVKAAACLGSSGGALSTASVLVSWLPAPPAAPADIAAMGLFTALSQRHTDREVYAIEPPVGPAVAVRTRRPHPAVSAWVLGWGTEGPGAINGSSPAPPWSGSGRPAPGSRGRRGGTAGVCTG